MTFEYSKRVPHNDNDVVGEILEAAANPAVISFAGGLPAPELFPVEGMKKAADTVFDNEGQTALQYSNAVGETVLREEIVKLMTDRGVDTSVEHVGVTTGSEQSIDLLAKMFVNPGDTVIVEEPTYLCTLDVFRSYGANIVGVEMDENGMRMDKFEEALKAHPEAKLVYTIPTFQNPTGRTMSVDRRKKFVELANKYDLLVMEDDPYGAIRYEGEELPPLKKFDTQDRVVYMSTFSKILAPGMRLGWIVCNVDVLSNFVVMKQSADLHSDNLSQHIIATFLKQNDVYEHIKKISDLYRHRFELMLDYIKKEFPADAKHSHPEGGMFIWIELPGEVDTMELFKTCVEHNVAFVPGDAFYPNKPKMGTFRLNFSNVDDETIEVGMKRLGTALKEALEATK
ncbi:PLP-dependent aminotransferase family protein (plasmid) [Nicoliella spurrieriana]|uniref:PLP-dependent aminotransferase family protein n=1 Tax=Nicoliella spurrieriana TaxID=2925830 RepID=A0A976RQQ2_9LACO|nr:PLP-dependent aminotransferase family protein [Nicoliella spurrieriana]UQS86157.1 PLP-dependent aminotransferase family protein [Nicoliella spurrieriana]